MRGGGGGGARGAKALPGIFQMAIFGHKKQVILMQNHLIFGQAPKKIFKQETSAPPPPLPRIYLSI